MNENSISEKKELEELLDNIYKNNRIRIPVFSVFLIICLILIWIGAAIPRLAIWILAVILILTLFYGYYFKKVGPKLKLSRLSASYLITQIVEIILLLALLHFWGAISMGGMVVFMVYLIFGYFAFTRAVYPRIMALVIALGYFFVALLEHLGIISVVDVYGLGINLIKIPSAFYTNVIFMVGLLIVLAVYGDIFSKKVRESIKILTKNERELTEVKKSLEKKVRSRTKELEELTKSLELKVKERTKEIEKKGRELEENTKRLQEKIVEMERFQELSVGREIKMTELKREVEKLKEQLKNSK